MLQLDDVFTMGAEVGASVTRKNRSIGLPDGAVLSYTATNLATGASGARHVVQIDLSVTFPGAVQFAEIINAITVDTLPSPTEPPIHTDVITPGNEGLIISEQLDFRVTMSYRAGLTTTNTYAVRIRIDGSYE